MLFRSQAGLYFKTPVTQTANYFDKRIMRWDGDPNQIPTKDKKFIWVDTTARWHIVDPLKFMQSVGSETAAYARLDDIIDSAVRDAVSNFDLVETVRNTNRLADSNLITEAEDEIKIDVALERISVGREALTRDILKRASHIVPQYGIELIDVRIKRVNYVQEVWQKVYERKIFPQKQHPPHHPNY